MSDTVFKFYPLNPRCTFEPEVVTGIESFLRRFNGASIVEGSIEVMTFDGIQFIDCGTNFQCVCCARCGREIDHDLWQDTMDADYLEASGFQLSERVSCSCALSSLLYGLTYHASCRFASACLSVRVSSHFLTGWLRHFPWIGLVEARY